MWLNLIGFNLCWLGLVLLGNNFIPIALVWLIAHLYLVKQPFKEITVILSVATIGIIVDSFLTLIGIFDFSSASHSAILPLWLMVLWLCFAATIDHGLKFLKKSKLLISGAALLGPPLSYLAGQKLSAVSFGFSHLTTMMTLALVWLVLLHLFFALSSKIVKHEVIYEQS